MSRIKKWAKKLKQQTLVVYFAARNSRTPLVVRCLALAVAAYALSPIDLIPDFIPVLGYLDDLIIVPLGLMLVLRLTPEEVLVASREKAQAIMDKPVSRAAAIIIVGIWIISVSAMGAWAYFSLTRSSFSF